MLLSSFERLFSLSSTLPRRRFIENKINESLHTVEQYRHKQLIYLFYFNHTHNGIQYYIK